MTRSTLGSAVRDAIVVASSPASAGVVFIFQLAAMMTGRITRESCQSAALPGPGRSAPCAATSDPLVGMEREVLDPLERPLHGRAVDVQPLCQLAQRRLRRLASSIGDEADDGWLDGQAAVGLDLLDRRDLAAGSAHGAMEIRRLGVEDPVEVAA